MCLFDNHPNGQLISELDASIIYSSFTRDILRKVASGTPDAVPCPMRGAKLELFILKSWVSTINVSGMTWMRRI